MINLIYDKSPNVQEMRPKDFKVVNLRKNIEPKYNQPIIIVFYAHWCPHCQREVPLLVEWEKSGKMPGNIDVLAVTTGTDSANPNYPPSEWLARENFPATWPVLADSADKVGGDAFGLAGYPYFVLVGGDGKVLWRSSGEVPMDELAATILALTGA